MEEWEVWLYFLVIHSIKYVILVRKLVNANLGILMEYWS